LHTFLWISLGAIVGANLRYWVAQQAAKWMGPDYPWGTLAVNVSGSFVLGFFLLWSTDRAAADTRWRLLIAVGFCGGFTTFSSFAAETVALFEHGHWGRAAVNVVASSVLSLSAVVLGAMTARGLFPTAR
jgi:CrcB protein